MGINLINTSSIFLNKISNSSNSSILVIAKIYPEAITETKELGRNTFFLE